jgi:CheY-like chemotaxis protein
MVRGLPHGTYGVEAVGDEQSALAAIIRERPNVVVFNVPAKGGVDLVRRLRAVDASGQMYLVAIFDASCSSKEIANVIDAGAQDFIRRPVTDAELAQRVRAPERVVRWARGLNKPAVFDLVAPVDVTGLLAWRTLGPLVADDLAQIAGSRFTVSEGWPQQFSGAVHRAVIPMSLAGDKLEVRVAVALDEQALSWLRESVLCDPSAGHDATDDALREFANTAGGALKRAALGEGVTLTTGMPINDTDAYAAATQSCWTLTLADRKACIAVLGEVRKIETLRVSATKLCEGMVLAHDVRSEGGVLLVPAGSRLTSTTASRLSQLLGPRFFLEVAPFSGL